jgi:hypothetical protein
MKKTQTVAISAVLLLPGGCAGTGSTITRGNCEAIL